MNDASDARSQSPSKSLAPPVASKRRLLWGIAILSVLAVYTGWNFSSVTGFWDEVAQTGKFPTSRGARSYERTPPTFDTRISLIPVNEIRSGGPPKDGIPAISQPKFLPTSRASYLRPDDRVIGVALGQEARAYPLRILNYHEIVNDRLGETPLAITYCPLCDSSIVFDRRTPLGEFEFGVSGLLYNSNVLLYNRTSTTESLWSQLQATGVTGPAAGKALKALPFEVTSWQDWSTRHPETTVVSDQTGHPRDYNSNPYSEYFRSPELMFPVSRIDNRLPPKTRVLGIWTDNVAKAYVIAGIQKERFHDTISGKRVSLQYTAEVDSLRVVEAEEGVQWMYTFWFAWSAFHPETEVLLPEQPQ